MQEIRLKDAKARLSAVVDDDAKGEAFVITRHGRREAVILSWAEWERLSTVPSFGRLLTMAPLQESDLPPRDPAPMRDPEL